MNLLLDIEQETRNATAEVERYTGNLRAYIAALPFLASVLPSIEFDWIYTYPNENKIICRVQKRADFAPLRTLRRGVWKKRIGEEDGSTVVQYSGQLDCGTLVLCYVCELPPSCRIEETPVEVPAHTRIDRKVICNGPPEPLTKEWFSATLNPPDHDDGTH